MGKNSILVRVKLDEESVLGQIGKIRDLLNEAERTIEKLAWSSFLCTWLWQ